MALLRKGRGGGRKCCYGEKSDLVRSINGLKVKDLLLICRVLCGKYVWGRKEGQGGGKL